MACWGLAIPSRHSQSVLAVMADSLRSALSFHCHVSWDPQDRWNPPALTLMPRPDEAPRGSEIAGGRPIDAEQHGDGGHDPRSMRRHGSSVHCRIIGMLGYDAVVWLGEPRYSRYASRAFYDAIAWSRLPCGRMVVVGARDCEDFAGHASLFAEAAFAQAVRGPRRVREGRRAAERSDARAWEKRMILPPCVGSRPEPRRFR